MKLVPILSSGVANSLRRVLANNKLPFVRYDQFTFKCVFSTASSKKPVKKNQQKATSLTNAPKPESMESDMRVMLKLTSPKNIRDIKLLTTEFSKIAPRSLADAGPHYKRLFDKCNSTIIMESNDLSTCISYYKQRKSLGMATLRPVYSSLCDKIIPDSSALSINFLRDFRKEGGKKFTAAQSQSLDQIIRDRSSNQQLQPVNITDNAVGSNNVSEEMNMAESNPFLEQAIQPIQPVAQSMDSDMRVMVGLTNPKNTNDIKLFTTKFSRITPRNLRDTSSLYRILFDQCNRKIIMESNDLSTCISFYKQRKSLGIPSFPPVYKSLCDKILQDSSALSIEFLREFRRDGDKKFTAAQSQSLDQLIRDRTPSQQLPVVDSKSTTVTANNSMEEVVHNTKVAEPKLVDNAVGSINADKVVGSNTSDSVVVNVGEEMKSENVVNDPNPFLEQPIQPITQSVESDMRVMLKLTSPKNITDIKLLTAEFSKIVPRNLAEAGPHYKRLFDKCNRTIIMESNDLSVCISYYKQRKSLGLATSSAVYEHLCNKIIPDSSALSINFLRDFRKDGVKKFTAAQSQSLDQIIRDRTPSQQLPVVSKDTTSTKNVIKNNSMQEVAHNTKVAEPKPVDIGVESNNVDKVGGANTVDSVVVNVGEEMQAANVVNDSNPFLEQPVAQSMESDMRIMVGLTNPKHAYRIKPFIAKFSRIAPRNLAHTSPQYRKLFDQCNRKIIMESSDLSTCISYYKERRRLGIATLPDVYEQLYNKIIPDSSALSIKFLREFRKDGDKKLTAAQSQSLDQLIRDRSSLVTILKSIETNLQPDNKYYNNMSTIDDIFKEANVLFDPLTASQEEFNNVEHKLQCLLRSSDDSAEYYFNYLVKYDMNVPDDCLQIVCLNMLKENSINDVRRLLRSRISATTDKPSDQFVQQLIAACGERNIDVSQLNPTVSKDNATKKAKKNTSNTKEIQPEVVHISSSVAEPKPVDSSVVGSNAVDSAVVNVGEEVKKDNVSRNLEKKLYATFKKLIKAIKSGKVKEVASIQPELLKHMVQVLRTPRVFLTNDDIHNMVSHLPPVSNVVNNPTHLKQYEEIYQKLVMVGSRNFSSDYLKLLHTNNLSIPYECLYAACQTMLKFGKKELKNTLLTHDTSIDLKLVQDLLAFATKKGIQGPNVEMLKYIETSMLSPSTATDADIQLQSSINEHVDIQNNAELPSMFIDNEVTSPSTAISNTLETQPVIVVDHTPVIIDIQNDAVLHNVELIGNEIGKPHTPDTQPDSVALHLSMESPVVPMSEEVVRNINVSQLIPAVSKDTKSTKKVKVNNANKKEIQPEVTHISSNVAESKLVDILVESNNVDKVVGSNTVGSAVLKVGEEMKKDNVSRTLEKKLNTTFKKLVKAKNSGKKSEVANLQAELFEHVMQFVRTPRVLFITFDDIHNMVSHLPPVSKVVDNPTHLKQYEEIYQKLLMVGSKNFSLDYLKLLQDNNLNIPYECLYAACQTMLKFGKKELKDTMVAHANDVDLKFVQDLLAYSTKKGIKGPNVELLQYIESAMASHAAATEADAQLQTLTITENVDKQNDAVLLSVELIDKEFTNPPIVVPNTLDLQPDLVTLQLSMESPVVPMSENIHQDTVLHTFQFDKEIISSSTVPNTQETQQMAMPVQSPIVEKVEIQNEGLQKHAKKAIKLVEMETTIPSAMVPNTLEAQHNALLHNIQQIKDTSSPEDVKKLVPSIRRLLQNILQYPTEDVRPLAVNLKYAFNKLPVPSEKSLKPRKIYEEICVKLLLLIPEQSAPFMNILKQNNMSVPVDHIDAVNQAMLENNNNELQSLLKSDVSMPIDMTSKVDPLLIQDVLQFAKQKEIKGPLVDILTNMNEADSIAQMSIQTEYRKMLSNATHRLKIAQDDKSREKAAKEQAYITQLISQILQGTPDSMKPLSRYVSIAFKMSVPTDRSSELFKQYEDICHKLILSIPEESWRYFDVVSQNSLSLSADCYKVMCQSVLENSKLELRALLESSLKSSLANSTIDSTFVQELLQFAKQKELKGPLVDTLTNINEAPAESKAATDTSGPGSIPKRDLRTLDKSVGRLIIAWKKNQFKKAANEEASIIQQLSQILQGTTEEIRPLSENLCYAFGKLSVPTGRSSELFKQYEDICHKLILLIPEESWRYFDVVSQNSLSLSVDCYKVMCQSVLENDKIELRALLESSLKSSLANNTIDSKFVQELLHFAKQKELKGPLVDTFANMSEAPKERKVVDTIQRKHFDSQKVVTQPLIEISQHPVENINVRLPSSPFEQRKLLVECVDQLKVAKENHSIEQAKLESSISNLLSHMLQAPNENIRPFIIDVEQAFSTLSVPNNESYKLFQQYEEICQRLLMLLPEHSLKYFDILVQNGMLVPFDCFKVACRSMLESDNSEYLALLKHNLTSNNSPYNIDNVFIQDLIQFASEKELKGPIVDMLNNINKSRDASTAQIARKSPNAIYARNSPKLSFLEVAHNVIFGLVTKLTRTRAEGNRREAADLENRLREVLLQYLRSPHSQQLFNQLSYAFTKLPNPGNDMLVDASYREDYEEICQRLLLIAPEKLSLRYFNRLEANNMIVTRECLEFVCQTMLRYGIREVQNVVVSGMNRPDDAPDKIDTIFIQNLLHYAQEHKIKGPLVDMLTHRLVFVQQPLLLKVVEAKTPEEVLSTNVDLLQEIHKSLYAVEHFNPEYIRYAFSKLTQPWKLRVQHEEYLKLYAECVYKLILSATDNMSIGLFRILNRNSLPVPLDCFKAVCQRLLQNQDSAVVYLVDERLGFPEDDPERIDKEFVRELLAYCEHNKIEGYNVNQLRVMSETNLKTIPTIDQAIKLISSDDVNKYSAVLNAIDRVFGLAKEKAHEYERLVPLFKQLVAPSTHDDYARQYYAVANKLLVLAYKLQDFRTAQYLLKLVCSTGAPYDIHSVWQQSVSYIQTDEPELLKKLLLDKLICNINGVVDELFLEKLIVYCKNNTSRQQWIPMLEEMLQYDVKGVSASEAQYPEYLERFRQLKEALSEQVNVGSKSLMPEDYKLVKDSFMFLFSLYNKPEYLEIATSCSNLMVEFACMQNDFVFCNEVYRRMVDDKLVPTQEAWLSHCVALLSRGKISDVATMMKSLKVDDNFSFKLDSFLSEILSLSNKMSMNFQSNLIENLINQRRSISMAEARKVAVNKDRNWQAVHHRKPKTFESEVEQVVNAQSLHFVPLDAPEPVKRTRRQNIQADIGIADYYEASVLRKTEKSVPVSTAAQTAMDMLNYADDSLSPFSLSSSNFNQQPEAMKTVSNFSSMSLSSGVKLLKKNLGMYGLSQHNSALLSNIEEILNKSMELSVQEFENQLQCSLDECLNALVNETRIENSQCATVLQLLEYLQSIQYEVDSKFLALAYKSAIICERHEYADSILNDLMKQSNNLPIDLLLLKQKALIISGHALRCFILLDDLYSKYGNLDRALYKPLLTYFVERHDARGLKAVKRMMASHNVEVDDIEVARQSKDRSSNYEFDEKLFKSETKVTSIKGQTVDDFVTQIENFIRFDMSDKCYQVLQGLYEQNLLMTNELYLPMMDFALEEKKSWEIKRYFELLMSHGVMPNSKTLDKLKIVNMSFEKPEQSKLESFDDVYNDLVAANDNTELGWFKVVRGYVLAGQLKQAEYIVNELVELKFPLWSDLFYPLMSVYFEKQMHDDLQRLYRVLIQHSVPLNNNVNNLMKQFNKSQRSKTEVSNVDPILCALASKSTSGRELKPITLEFDTVYDKLVANRANTEDGWIQVLHEQLSDNHLENAVYLLTSMHNAGFKIVADFLTPVLMFCHQRKYVVEFDILREMMLRYQLPSNATIDGLVKKRRQQLTSSHESNDDRESGGAVFSS